MAINLIVDAVIVLILLIGIIIGVKRGFVATVAKPVRIVASAGVAFCLCKPAGTQYIQPYIQKPLVSWMTELIEEKCGELTSGAASSDIPTVLKLVAKMFKIDVNTVAEQATASIVEAIVNALADPLANLAATIVAFVILFLATSIVCWLLFKIIDLVLNCGPLEIVNKVFGLIFGAIFAFVVVWALTVGFDFLLTLEVVSNIEALQGFTGGPVYQLVKQLNPIDLLFKF